MRRWRIRRRLRRARRIARTSILFVIAAGVAIALPTPERSAIETLPGRLVESVERAIGRTADRVRIHRGSSSASRSALSGAARVVDGDTLDVAGARVRLHGIDAPESAQRCRASGRSWPCGREAMRALASRIGDQGISCEERDRDGYGRVVAVCAAAGLDLNEWMVSQGWAFAYRRYSRDYVAAESRARAARRGIWRGEAVAPWEWRRGRRLPGSAPAARRDGGGCRIKGNIGRDGRRIYHVPGGQYYDRTRIDASRGERWFCSERAARAAGWWRSRR